MSLTTPSVLCLPTRPSFFCLHFVKGYFWNAMLQKRYDSSDSWAWDNLTEEPGYDIRVHLHSVFKFTRTLYGYVIAEETTHMVNIFWHLLHTQMKNMEEIKTRNNRIASLGSANGRNQNDSKRLARKQRSTNPVHGWLRHRNMKHLNVVPLWWNHRFSTCMKMSPRIHQPQIRSTFQAAA